MAIQQFDYDNQNNTPVEDAPTSRIVPFKYDEVDVKQPVAQVPVTPSLTQTKPQFKKFSELSTKDKIDLGFNRLGLKVGSGVGAMTASAIKSLSYGKDLIKGTFSGSTISEELANDTTFDKKVKGFADEYQRLTSQGMSEQLSQKKSELGLDPNDQFTDKVFEGLGSLFGFVGTGFASKIGSVAVGFGKYAPVVASGVNTLGESLTEAQDVYETVKAEGGDDKKAFEAFRSTLAGNALLIGLTNKLGGMFDDTLYQGIKRAVKVGFSGTMEGFQEGYQTLLSNANTGKPLFEGVKESFLIGTILGAPASAALDFGDRSKAKEQIDAMDVPQEQKDVAKAIVDKTATEEEISQAFTQAVTDPESGITADENVTTTLKEDVQTLLDQGQNIGEVVIALQEEGIKKSDAENIVAEILADQQQQAETSTIEVPEKGGIASHEVKTLEEEAKKYKTVDEFVNANSVQRVEDVGVETSFDKPQGLYTTPANVESPHTDVLKGKKSIFGVDPNAKSVTVDTSGLSKTPNERGVDQMATSLVWLRKELPAISDSIRGKSFNELKAIFSKEYPNTKWDLYAEKQDMIEGYAGLKARDKGYDILRGVDKDDPRFSEVVILNKNIVKTKQELTDIYEKATKPKEEKKAEPMSKPKSETKKEETNKSPVKDRLQKIFDKFKAIKKGEDVPNPNEIIKTEYKLADIIKKTLKIDNPNVVFTGKTLKHISEKGENAQALFDSIPEILKNPTEIRKDGKQFVIIGDIKNSRRNPLTASVIEVEKSGNNVIITVFPTRDKSLESFELLWRTADPTSKGISPSHQELETQGGGSRLSDLKATQKPQSEEIVAKKEEQVKDNTYKLSDEKKKGIRSVAKNLEEKAKELGISIEDSYEMKRFVEEVAISEQYLENNKDKIEDILNGAFPYPQDVSKTAFLHTVIENAKANNDTKMLTKAYNALAEEGTTAGQNIAFINSIYKTYDETSPETYLNKIRAERESMAFRKDWKLKNPFAIDEKKKEFIKKRTQRQKAIKTGVKDRTTVKIKELENILESFMC